MIVTLFVTILVVPFTGPYSLDSQPNLSTAFAYTLTVVSALTCSSNVYAVPGEIVFDHVPSSPNLYLYPARSEPLSVLPLALAVTVFNPVVTDIAVGLLGASLSIYCIFIALCV